LKNSTAESKILTKTSAENIIRLHQKRNALKVIASCTTFGDISWRIISEHIPLYPEESILKKCMKYYYFWNMIAERNTVFSYYVEQLPEIWDKFCEVIGHSLTYRDIPKNINTRQGEYPALSWRDLEREDPILCRLIRKQC